MNPENRRKLEDRVVKAAEASLAAQGYASPIDVLVGIGWLDPSAVKRWRQGQIDCLERVVQANLSRISEAMKLFRSWASAKGLSASETHYVTRTPQRQTLRFSRSGNPAIEKAYRTHWVSRALSERKRERLADKASRAPTLS
jgi:poly(3-hydroxybutyrate) depolymerase